MRCTVVCEIYVGVLAGATKKKMTLLRHIHIYISTWQ